MNPLASISPAANPDTPSIRLLGWESRRKTYLDFHKCLECGKRRESLSGGADARAECYRCGSKSPFEQWERGRARRYIAVCRLCGNDLPLTVGGRFDFCDCSNIVAVYFGRRILCR